MDVIYGTQNCLVVYSYSYCSKNTSELDTRNKVNKPVVTQDQLYIVTVVITKLLTSICTESQLGKNCFE